MRAMFVLNKAREGPGADIEEDALENSSRSLVRTCARTSTQLCTVRSCQELAYLCVGHLERRRQHKRCKLFKGMRDPDAAANISPRIIMGQGTGAQALEARQESM